MKNKKQDIRPRNANGEPHGDWIMYYDNRQLWYNGCYNNGLKHGDCVMYYDNGKLMYKGSYINDNRVGMWKQWNWNTNEYDNIFYG